jgi:hypothetical protein
MIERNNNCSAWSVGAGPILKPSVVFDLKTGWFDYMSTRQANNYGKNFPYGTPFTTLSPSGG